MYVVESKGGAIVCMLLALLFLGTWPAVPQHTYLDYSITNLLAAVIIALTFGEIGKGTPSAPNFFTQLSQDNWPSVLFAMAGGVVLSIGTTMNYFLDDKINRADILFPSVGCFLIAVCLGSFVHASNAADNKEKLKSLSTEATGFSTDKETLKNNVVRESDVENGSGSAEKARAGTAGFLIELENRRSIKVFGRSTITGLAITFFAGICFSLFSPAFNLATNDQWHTLKEGVSHLSVYTAFFYFSVSCFVIGIVLNIIFLYHPILNLPKSSLKAYLSDWNGRGWAFLAGFLCGFGNGLQFMGGEAAGYAAADSVQVSFITYTSQYVDTYCYIQL
ncbi:ureide permease 1-like isoform X3 [Castanea sativa]|uniref:ureide permease 1-like isoform X3 n=1 Tax=Castanea sativa TaxID=21020 RepID=UPI003F64A3BC